MSILFAYTTLFRSYLVNEFMENIDRTEVENPDLRNRMIAEMRVIRAKSYFRLISLFGGVPLINSTFDLDDDFRMERNSYEEVMQFVLEELALAIPDLELQSEMST